MRKHRNPQDTVSKNPDPDNFRPADALESLHAAILRVETITHIASDAVDRLHYPANPDTRRAFARMQILVGKAAEEASAALAEGDQLMAALTNHLQARRASREVALAKAPGL
jgi:5-carboxymethyl-2-hydroxymuconate isomerase